MSRPVKVEIYSAGHGVVVGEFMCEPGTVNIIHIYKNRHGQLVFSGAGLQHRCEPFPVIDGMQIRVTQE